MSSISPSNNIKNIGFKGLIQTGNYSHGIFLIALIIASLLVFLFTFCGLFLSNGNFLVGSIIALIFSTLIFFFGIKSAEGKVNGDSKLKHISLLGVMIITLISAFLGFHFLYHSSYISTPNYGDQLIANNNILDLKSEDLKKAETLINDYENFYNQLRINTLKTKDNCSYDLLNPIQINADTLISNTKELVQSLHNPFCLILKRDEILNRKGAIGINFSNYYNKIITRIKLHNNSWVSNKNCQVNEEILIKKNKEYSTKMNIEPPILASSLHLLPNSVFIVLFLIILLLAIMPYIAAKGSETILKPRN